MFCRNCGKPVDERAGNFCGSCGAKITLVAPVTQQQPNYAQNNMGQRPMQPQYAPPQYGQPQYAYNKASLEDVNKVVQTILSVALAIFSLLNAIAIFLPLMVDEDETILKMVEQGEDFGSPWLGLIASIFAVILICCCWKSDTVGYPAVVLFAIVICILDAIFVGKWKEIIIDEVWSNWESYKAIGLKFYSIGSVWIPICAVLKCTMDIIADKFKKPSYETRQFPNLGPAPGQTHLSHLVNNNEPTPQHYSNNSAHVLSSKTSATSSATHSPQNGWVCKDCGRVNYPYVGTCACGTDKDA